MLFGWSYIGGGLWGGGGGEWTLKRGVTLLLDSRKHEHSQAVQS